MSEPRMDRALALACDRALFGLTPDQEMELVALLPPGVRIDPGLELAAAAITMSELTIEEPLPQHVAERVLSAAGDPRAPAVARGGTIPIAAKQPEARTVLLASAPPPQASEPASSNVVPIASARPTRRVLPWVAAACFALAAGSGTYLVMRNGQAPPIAKGSATPANPSPAEARAKLLAEARDVVRTTWGETSDGAGKGETGEVVWSNERQEGYMTFRAVATNDPKAAQYQLWIFDAERDERYPVDGGVFDVDTSKGEVTIPISAKVAVRRPTLFAVTVEKPGGVVVSKRERIVVTAKPA